MKNFFALILMVVSFNTWAASLPIIHNHAKAFSEFWSKNKTNTSAGQLLTFQSEVESTFPEFYRYKREKWKSQGKNPDTEIAKHLQEFPQLEAQFSAKAEIIEKEISENLQTFFKTFDDFSTDFDIYIVHSLGEMDGGIRQIDGKSVFIFGIENILKYHNALTDVPFYQHELFHVYHFQRYEGPNQIWSFLWGEGLATYVSEVLNPGSNYSDIMLNVPEGMVAQCEQKMPELWQKMRASLESDSELDYETWFLLSSTDSTIPKRAGYYLGYLIAREIGQKYSLKELATMQGPPLLEAIHQALDKLAQPTTTHQLH